MTRFKQHPFYTNWFYTKTPSSPESSSMTISFCPFTAVAAVTTTLNCDVEVTRPSGLTSTTGVVVDCADEAMPVAAAGGDAAAVDAATELAALEDSCTDVSTAAEIDMAAVDSFVAEVPSLVVSLCSSTSIQPLLYSCLMDGGGI